MTDVIPFVPSNISLRPFALNDLPTPSQMRVQDGAGREWIIHTSENGRAGIPNFPANETLINLFLEADGQNNTPIPGYEWYGQQVQIPLAPVSDFWAIPIPAAYPRPLSVNWYQLPVLLKRNLPVVPSRSEVLGVNLTFQGLTVTTSQYGTLPWFEAALAWLNSVDRISVYNVKHEVGDTHCIIQLPFGPLYNEPGQPYSNFPDMDWTNGNTIINPAFRSLVLEVISNGFTPIIFPNEEQDQSLIQMQMIIKALQGSPDLVPYCILMTGWDGVFYGWPGGPDAIVSWGQTMRNLAPNCYLGIEHDPGHIPVGEGGSDYQPGGRMENFDVIFGEFTDSDNSAQGNDSIWQILGRMIRPYNRPSDQPSSDDPNPPFYLVDSPRGPRTYVAFEYNVRFGEYAWVRSQVSVEQINQHRNYFKQMGSKYNG